MRKMLWWREEFRDVSTRFYYMLRMYTIEYAKKLVASGAAYYCFCDKEDEPAEADAVPSTLSCPGNCRDLDPAEAEKRVANGEPFVIRQKIDRSGTSTFSDLVFGDITIENKVLDDQILLKRDGMPTYNFANVVDDHLMGITHVVRGSEYLSSTPKYNLLYRAFGWELPTYVHLPIPSRGAIFICLLNISRFSGTRLNSTCLILNPMRQLSSVLLR